MAATPFLTDSELVSAVAQVLRQQGVTLSTAWYDPITGTGIIPDANQAAYRDIRGALLMRSFGANQVDNWDRGREFNLDLGIFWSLVKGAGLYAYDDRWVERLDRRKELKEVLVEVAGGATTPPTGVPPGIGYGHATVTRHEVLQLRRFAGEGWPVCCPVFGPGPLPPFYGGTGPVAITEDGGKCPLLQLLPAPM